MKTYVYDGMEVRLTGRKAQRNNVASRSSRVQQNPSDILVEIEPSDPEALHFKKWVAMDQLYIIIEGDDNVST